ncbi:MAG: Trm112 family protein [Phycisphaerae bacterium]
MSEISPQILELLACPQPSCRGKLALEASSLVCGKCGQRYRIEHGFPVLIPEESQPPGTPAGQQ